MFLAVVQSGFRCLRGALALYAALALCGIAARADTGFTFNHVARAVGSADILGYAVWTAPLGTVSLSGNDVPLRLDFTTDQRPPPFGSPLGRGWSLPFFASALVEESQTTLRWHRPDGRIFYFARERGNQKTKPAKPSDSIEFISTEASWRAVKDPRRRSVVISHITNGTELVYEDGRLVRFRFSKLGESADSYVIYYNRLGRPLRLSSLKTGKALVEFAYENAALAKSISIGNKTISLKFDEFTLTQFPTGPYLSEVGEGSLMPLKITYKTVGAKVNSARFENMADGGGNTGLSWNAATGFITEDDGGKYKIENPSLANGGRVVNDPKKPVSSVNGVLPYNWRPDEAKITRVDREGKSQYRYFDRSKGVSTNRDKDGVTKVVYFLQAQGALMNKVRKIEEIRNGKTTVLERNAYNESGRMVRQIDALGGVTVWEWSTDGNFVRVIKDGQLIEETVYKNRRLIAWKTFGPEGAKVRTSQSAVAEFGNKVEELVPEGFLGR
jgi:hypothetical protein